MANMLTFEDGSFPVNKVKSDETQVSFIINNWAKGTSQFAELHKQLIDRLDNYGGSELDISGVFEQDLFEAADYSLNGDHLMVTLHRSI